MRYRSFLVMLAGLGVAWWSVALTVDNRRHLERGADGWSPLLVPVLVTGTVIAVPAAVSLLTARRAILRIAGVVGLLVLAGAAVTVRVQWNPQRVQDVPGVGGPTPHPMTVVIGQVAPTTSAP